VVHDNGRGTLEDNDIFANTEAGVAIGNGGDPILRRNRIRGCKAGVDVGKNGRGTLEGNHISDNAHWGIESSSGGMPTVRGNCINNNGYSGVWVHDSGGGRFEDNDLRNNGREAFSIEEGCRGNITLLNNKE
jgi:parallel beta-helix repeat protein